MNVIDSHSEISLKGEHILEDIKRIIGEMHERCKINKVFPQNDSIYLLIEIDKDHYMG
jgi:hypothetical protein